jgi:hypothetical protein
MPLHSDGFEVPRDLIDWSFAVIGKHKHLVLFSVLNTTAGLAGPLLCSHWIPESLVRFRQACVS